WEVTVEDIMASGDPPPVPPEHKDALVEPFVSAVCMTLSEMARTETGVRRVGPPALPRAVDDLSAVLMLTSERVRAVVLRFPARTAAVLAGRVFTEVALCPDEETVRDCMGEFVNVVAGQAKTLLFGTPYHFTLSTPTVVSGAAGEVPGAGCLDMTFTSD